MPSDRSQDPTSDLEARESRLRRVAARRGLAIEKSEAAGYRIVDPQSEAVVHDGPSGNHSLTIEQAEAFLGDPENQQAIDIENLNAANDE